MKVQLAPERPRVYVSLGDGGVAVLSPLLPEDRPLLIAGLDEMTVEDRFARFGQGRSRLTGGELDYLTDIDQRRHVAWAAVIEGRGAGIGRYIVGEDDAAEVAITVLEPFQGRGVGRALFDALAAVARHDGVGQFCFEVLESNLKVLQILQSRRLTLHHRDGMIEGCIILDAPVAADDQFVAVMEAHRTGQLRSPRAPNRERQS